MARPGSAQVNAGQAGLLDFAYPWLALLLPAPWLARRLLPASDRAELALAVPLLAAAGAEQLLSQRRGRRLARTCLWLFWLCLLLAAARPYWTGEPITRTVSGRDLVLAVDISGSMSEADMTINAATASRLDVLKLVVDRFIGRRDGDRLGLILFGTHAYSFVPLTFDLDSLRVLLQDTSTGLAGRHTAIGDAIGLAIKSMRDQATQHKVLILATDGSNTAGFDDPVRVALAARQHGLTIYTIGIGSDEQTLSKTYGLQSIPPGTALNEAMLREIALVTGGDYFRATDTASLERIYAALDELEPVDHEYQSYRPRHDLFAWPLGAACAVLLALTGLLVLPARRGNPA